MSIVSKIVLTGGPCVGKTTALSTIEESLTERGYKVFIVGESATEMIKGGIRPFGDKSIENYFFQNLILDYQIQKEEIYERAAISLENEKCIILYDRGLMDNKAYLGKKLFGKLLGEKGLNELKLLDNYDMVLHLVTAADGKEEYYTLENNEARSETVEEAITLDRKTANAWVGHENLKIIDNSTNFQDKLNRVKNEINNLLGQPLTTKCQKKYVVDINKSNLAFLNEDGVTKIEIEQSYLKSDKTKDNYERRLRKRTLNGENTYYFTVQRKGNDGVSDIVTNKKVTEKEYSKLLSMYEIDSIVRKNRYSFINNKQYCRLDIFDNDLAILEVEATLDKKKITSLPKFISIIEEVTNNSNFRNSNLYKIVKKERVLTN